MRVYKRHTEESPVPYLNNCYIGDKLNELDIEVTSFDSLFEFYKVNQIDYIQFRQYLKDYVLPLWASIDNTERIKLAEHNVVPIPEDKDVFFTNEEQRENYFLITQKETAARQKRWDKAMAEAAFELLDNKLYQLMMYSDCKRFRDDYIEADLPHLVLWLSNGSYPPLGIDYTNDGFAQKEYFSEAIRDKTLAVLTL